MLSIGDSLFDPASRRLIRGQTETKLSPKAAGVLSALAETPGQVWSRDALLERVWPLVHVGEEVLTHAIAELRRALGDDFRAPKYLGTVHKYGYRLLAEAQPPAKDAAPQTEDAPFTVQAYASYLTAVELYERGGRQNTEAAVDLFSELTQSHPRFAQGHIGLARALVFLGTYYTGKENVISEALDHCATAHRLTSGSADAFAAEGFIHAVAGDSRRSATCFQMALALRPDDAETHYLLGRASMVESDWSTAVLIFERAINLRPTDSRSLLIAGTLHLGLGHHQMAAAKYRAALGPIEEQLAQDPNDVRALRGKARCLWQLGRREAAFDLMDALTRQPDPLNYQLACALACAGENERALNVLEEAVELGWRHKAWMDRDPDLDRLRGHPRFERIRQSIS